MPKQSTSLGQMPNMLKNQIQIACRNLWKRKWFSFVNVAGLTAGVSAGFFIMLYINFEFSYDRFHSKANRIYRLACDIKATNGDKSTYNTPAAMASYLKAEFPEIESSVRIIKTSWLVRKDNVKFQENNVFIVDSTFFSMFDFPLMEGNALVALRKPLSVVLSQTAAKKYFGTSDPVGQQIKLTGGSYEGIVTGVMKDMPQNTQFKTDIIISLNTIALYDSTFENRWNELGVTTFLLLNKGANIDGLSHKLPKFIESHLGNQMRQEKISYNLSLEPLKEIYLHSKRGGYETGSLKGIYIFSFIALFILLVACINFVNLSTASNTERAKEVGIKKVIGATRIQIANQFLGESVVLSFAAFFLSIAVIYLLIPSFNQVAGKTIVAGYFIGLQNSILLFLLTIGIGMLAAIYPAVVLSSFKPISALRKYYTSGNNGNILRKTLVVIQFTISAILIFGTLVIYRQLKYMRSRDLGFSAQQVLAIDTHGDDNAKAFMNDLANLKDVSETCMSSEIPGNDNLASQLQMENNAGQMEVINASLCFVDFNFLKLYGIKLLAGRDFSKDFQTDFSRAIIINQTTAKMMGFKSPGSAIGKNFSQWGDKGIVVGVVRDFHFQSLQEQIQPLVMRLRVEGLDYISIKLAAGDFKNAILNIEKKWNAQIPTRPFSYIFIDESFNRKYHSEEQFETLVFFFSLIAIFLSSLGFLALASYSTLLRIKEIAIRKVLGASAFGIVVFLLKEFFLLIAFSLFLAFPIGWIIMNKWLEEFPYRTNISWSLFLIVSGATVVVSMMTISLHALKAAMSNPIKNLRPE
jgi:putative ABC transport system permease protein